MRLAVAAAALGAAVTAGLAAAGPSADTVTLQVGAKVLPSGQSGVPVVGFVSSGAAGEGVVIAGKECGIPGAFFRGLGSATTLPGGRYEGTANVRTKTTLRAEWRDAKSATVVVTPRHYIALAKLPDGFRIIVQSETQSVVGKKVTVQRLTPMGWKLLRTVVLKSAYGVQFGEVQGLRFKVPKGTTIRAVIPRSQTGPCYLAGYSKLLRT